MNRIPVFLSLILLVGSTAASQDGVSVKQTTDQELQHEGGTKSQNAELTSPHRSASWSGWLVAGSIKGRLQPSQRCAPGLTKTCGEGHQERMSENPKMIDQRSDLTASRHDEPSQCRSSRVLTRVPKNSTESWQFGGQRNVS